MTAAEPRRRYAGHGIPRLPGPRAGAPVELPGPDEATILPDPRAARERIFDRFLEANGRAPEYPNKPFPRLTARDVVVIANHLTFALRNDLSSIDAYDAAVIWEKWRIAVRDLRDLLRHVGLDDDAAIAGNILDHRTFDVHDCMALALSSPGDVFSTYCPWRAAWATASRIHPEAS